MTGELYGTPTDDVWKRVGSRAQVVSVESSIRTDGADAGSRRIHLVNGDLDVEVLPDRGLDIGQVRIAGVPLAWISPTGFGALSAEPGGWMRAFGGGLVTTCGLLSYGAPSVDAGTPHPLHGRYSSLRADVVRAEAGADELVVEGVVREAEVFGAHLEVRRRISSAVGSRTLRIDDVIVNRAATQVEPMVLYHLNLGWPVVDEGTTLSTPATRVEPRDAEAAAGLTSWARFPTPVAHFPEQVFRHELPAGERTEVRVESDRGPSVRIAFDTAVLPALFQWRVAEEDGHVVLGVEPATTPTILGRADARERGLLRPLAPGATLSLGVEIEAFPGVTPAR
ncbi:aldose 1-epimerase family protein [Microbacterium sp. NPDC080220]|uniref:aldose 1-epimerase family protein n=1 Tax=Microbacterium sp. NPDC080220 TaxID=3161017 RepID=UPI003415A007